MLDFRLVNNDRTRKNYFFFTVKKESSELKCQGNRGVFSVRIDKLSRNIIT